MNAPENPSRPLPARLAQLLARFPFIPHVKAMTPLAELEFLYGHRTETGDAVGERLAGSTNAGKTTLMVNMLRLHPPQWTSEGWRFDVVYLHIPERANLDDVYACLLQALGDPAPYTGGMKEKRARCRQLVERVGVKMVFVDEPHHLTESRSDGARLATTQWGKVFVDLGLTVVFGGVHSVDDLVSASPELARRFPGRLTMDPYDLADEGDLTAMRDFCDEVGKRLTRVRPVLLGSDNEFFSRLVVISGGFVGPIAKLTLQAESRAKLAGDSELRLKHFAQAWARFEHSQDENMKHLRRPKAKRLTNVFELRFDDVATLFGNMASAAA